MISAHCNLCGYDDTKVIQEAEPPYRVVQCRKCGLVYTHPVPDLQGLENHYDEQYYSDWVNKQKKNREKMWKKRVMEIRQYKKSGRLLDIGCGLETFLELSLEEGFQVQGTEVSEFIATQKKQGPNIEVFKGELAAASFPPSYFDVITMWHSLEHMPDPRKNLKETHRILKEDGVLVVAVPNLNNHITRFVYRLVKRKKLALFSPDAKELHLYHFTSDSLTKMLEQVGFEVEKVSLDLSAVVFQRKIIDVICGLIYYLTGKNYGDGFKLIARKAGASTRES